MLKTLAKLAAATALSATVLATPASAASDVGMLLRDANHTVTNMRHDPAFAQARDMVSHARAIYIVPKLVKGGFIFGAEGGDGVLLKRTAHGWSNPKFYGMGSASFGLQIGIQSAEVRKTSARSLAPKAKRRACSRKRSTTDVTRMFSEMPGRPGRRQQMPRTMRSMRTPASLAR